MHRAPAFRRWARDLVLLARRRQAGVKDEPATRARAAR
jgi:hypothetical protein